MTRSVRDFIRDKRISQAAQYDYRHASAELTMLAALETDPAKAKLYRHWAFIAANAARSEFFDPEPRG